ncbi:hypothetical protein ACQX9A_26970 (plasmid) [Klebsiella pneumoniae]
MNQHPRTVQRTINKLISKGFLKRKSAQNLSMTKA